MIGYLGAMGNGQLQSMGVAMLYVQGIDKQKLTEAGIEHSILFRTSYGNSQLLGHLIPILELQEYFYRSRTSMKLFLSVSFKFSSSASPLEAP